MEILETSYDYYKGCLSGEAPRLPEEMQPGYYRLRRAGMWVPVAVLADPARAVIGEQHQGLGWKLVTWSLDEAGFDWPRYGTNAVTRARWVDAVRSGRWDDDPPPIGHNLPPLDIGRPPLERAKAVIEQTLMWLETAPLEEARRSVADQAAELLHAVAAASGDCAAEMKSKAAPLTEALSELKAPYATAVHGLGDADEKLRKVLWEMMEALEVQRVGGVQRAVGFREKEDTEVTDAIAVLSRFRSDPRVMKLATTLANQERRLGVEDHPGWEVKWNKYMSM